MPKWLHQLLNNDKTPSWLRQFLSHEASPFQQFLKYAIVGGMATALNILAFYISAIFLFPSLTSGDIVVKMLGLSVVDLTVTRRALNAVFGNAIGFVFSNTVCYLLNRLFVFKPGRHHWLIEFLLFFGVSGISIVLGTTIQSWLIAQFGIQTTLAFGANLIMSLMINYAMRRFIIFSG